jgi:hypothetical protein
MGLRMIRGSLDVVLPTEAMGWAFCPGQTQPLLVQAILNHEMLGEAVADMHRPDLAAAGLGSGNAGFSIKFFRPIDPLYLPFITVKVEGGDIDLPRMPLVGYREFFTAYHAAQPAAGRHRSLSGGLWTDRTDAAALLQSKLRIGTLEPGAVTAIEQLIHNGASVISMSGLPDREAWRVGLAEKAGALLAQDFIRPALQGILEDQPLLAKAEWIGAAPTPFAQGSLRNPSPSPGDGLEILVALDDGVVLDIVRESHKLPEFDLNGKSRWTQADAVPGSLEESVGLLDRHELVSGTVALIGPGTICRVAAGGQEAALRLFCLPKRGQTIELGDAGTSKSVASAKRRAAAVIA